MIDNRDIPLPIDQLRSRVLVFAITDEATQQYEQITKGYVELTTDDDGDNHIIYTLEVKDQKTNQVLMCSNLNVEKNFGKQKGSIISWTDEQQPQYTQLALSFQKDKQCDQFWRTICEKIGKSYLQICGTDRLEIPTQNNLHELLEKAKNNIDLVDYNIVHSNNIMEGLRKVNNEMMINNDEMGRGIIWRIVHAIMSPAYSSNAIQVLLKGQNFIMLLDLQEFKKNIKFKYIYEQKIGIFLNNKFKLPEEIFQKVELSHRATFYRENVLNLSEQPQLQSMMYMISKQAIVEIVNYLNRSKFIEKILTNQTKQQTEQTCNQELSSYQYRLTQDKINFIIQALIMYHQITSEQIKLTFKEQLFTGGLLPFIKNQIELNNVQALQVLFYIIEIDRVKVLEYLVENFKANSTDNFLKTLMKKYMNQQQMRKQIIHIIQSMIPIFNQKRQTLEFFNGTFVYSIFSVAKDPKCILLLSNVLISQLQHSSALLAQCIKLKVFEKLTSQYRNGTLKSKANQLQLIKLLKYIIIDQDIKKQMKNKQIEKCIIESGYFDCCMLIYFKYSQRNNILSSSMLENLRLIEKSEYSKFDDYLIKEYSSHEALEKLLLPIKQKHIEHANNVKAIQKQKEFNQIQRINHQSILQNQQQDSYLMNEENEFSYAELTNGHKINEDRKTEDKQQKQIYLQDLKRMMHQVGDQDDEQIIKQPRKIVKKSEQNKQTIISIQFSLDLPDMDDLVVTPDT